MSHTIREKHRLLVRVRRIRGQMEAVERGLENEIGCEQVMHLIASARAAIAGLMAEVVEEHVETHLAQPKMQRAAAKELLSVMRTYLR
jgi:FrmR/RcnR family transcriptional regulator, repressor of frmRAB operon